MAKGKYAKGVKTTKKIDNTFTVSGEGIYYPNMDHKEIVIEEAKHGTNKKTIRKHC